ncbi:hypothetical protein HaLaN_09015, partial [Haematococcus lacustris]
MVGKAAAAPKVKAAPMRTRSSARVAGAVKKAAPKRSTATAKPVKKSPVKKPRTARKAPAARKARKGAAT